MTILIMCETRKMRLVSKILINLEILVGIAKTTWEKSRSTSDLEPQNDPKRPGQPD